MELLVGELLERQRADELQRVVADEVGELAAHGITAEESAKDQVLSETISVPRSCLGQDEPIISWPLRKYTTPEPRSPVKA